MKFISLCLQVHMCVFVHVYVLPSLQGSESSLSITFESAQIVVVLQDEKETFLQTNKLK